MATITSIALDPNYEPVFASQSTLLTDIDAVAQIIGTRLRLFQGEWWESLTEGTAMFQTILGHGKNLQAVASILRARILGTPYVNSISTVAISFNPYTRQLSYSCNVQTAFGQLTISTGGN